MIAMTNETVNNSNLLRQLKTSQKVYTILPEVVECCDPNEYHLIDHPVKDSIQIVNTGRVIFTRNNRSKGYFNGSLGTVLSIEAVKDVVQSLTVRLDNGPTIVLDKETIPIYWQNTTQNNQVYPQVLARVKSFPIRPAYAFTAHKSQGMTIPSAIVSKENYPLCFGQIYTSLSRIPSLENLFLTMQLRKEDFIVSPYVKEYLGMLAKRLYPA